MKRAAARAILLACLSPALPARAGPPAEGEPVAAPSGAAVYRILCVRVAVTRPEPPELDSWPRRLETLLNAQGPRTPFVVIDHPPGPAPLLRATLPFYLDRYAPDLVLASAGLPESLAELMRASGRPLVLLSSAAPDAQRVAQSAAAEVRRLRGAARPEDSDAGSLARAYRAAARAHRELGDEAGAAPALAELLKLEPEEPATLLSLAHIRADEDLLWEALPFAERAGRSPAASPEQRREAWRLAGELRATLGDLEEAVAQLGRAREAGRDDPELLRELALAQRDEPERALGLLEGALGRDAPARLRLLAAGLRRELGDLPGAARELERALESDPDDLEAWSMLAAVLRGQGRSAAAAARRAADAARRAPGWLRPAAYQLAARALLDSGQTERAIECLLRSAQLRPDDLDTLGMLARLKQSLSDEDLARLRRPAAAEPPGSEDRAAARGPGALEALRERIESARGRDWLEAKALALRFMRAAGKAPLWQQVDAHLLASRIWLELGDLPRSIQSVERARDLGWDSIAAQEALARLGLREGQDNAELALFSSSYARAAELRLALEDPAGAEACLRRALELNAGNPNAARLRDRLRGASK